MIKKGIFGGTFDPIHNGHLHVAYEALYRLNLDEIVFVPAGNPPHKTEKIITSGEKRIELIKKAIEKENQFQVSDYEVCKKELSYTYETLEHFNLLEPNTEWYFITGMDCLMQIDSWKNVGGILSKCRFVVFNRIGYNKEEILQQKIKVENKYNKNIIVLDMPILEISSTDIRKKIKRGENVSYLIPDTVNKALKKIDLYR